MIQLVILGLAILCVIAGIKTLVSGEISLTKTSQLRDAQARGAGIGLLVLAAVMAVFALFILPRL